MPGRDSGITRSRGASLAVEVEGSNARCDGIGGRLFASERLSSFGATSPKQTIAFSLSFSFLALGNGALLSHIHNTAHEAFVHSHSHGRKELHFHIDSSR